ncbi:MAG: TonB-dependent receptor [Candidatus Eisenbacteria bacterium]|nr:TonB-dependent receptor [Candidatus Eisenbacteria bacterium]
MTSPLLLAAALAAAVNAAPDTFPRIVPLPPVEVSTTRADARAPLARTTLTRGQVRELNWGQDTPMALGTLPGAYAYSDAGNGVGYSYLSLRGFPQRRISVLVNGVPLNDPESHEVWWIDHPDLLASTAELHVSRGVGPALYGAAALGGSVSLNTAPIGEVARRTASVSYGAWGTKRLLLEGDSGRLPGGWGLYGRYSRIETDGYRERSWSRLWSYALSAQKTSATQSWRLNLYGGPENTHLAYLGVTPGYLAGAVTGDADRDRRFNPITYPGEQDHFFEPHYELLHTWTPTAAVTLSQTLFWFDGRGWYDERRLGRSLADYRLAPWTTSDTTLFAHDYYALDANGNVVLDGQGRATVERFDLVRRREVVNRHYGWVPRARIAHDRGALTLGGELRFHDGRHVGTVISGSGLPPGTEPDHAYYDYHPRTLSAGLFAREEFDVTPALRATADFAWRHQGYRMRGDRFDGIAFRQQYDFALPRLGLSWTPKPAWSVYASFALARREPAFRDLYDAEGAGSVPLYRRVDVAAGVYEDPLIRPERVNDLELGGRWTGDGLLASVSAFRMDFRDELVNAGQFDTDLGYPILGNAARSVHQGVELAGSATRRFGALRGALEANATLSDNHFVRYRESWGPAPADGASYDGRPLGFFPAVMANSGVRATWRSASLGASVQHVGRIYVDNTGTKANSIAPRTTLDLSGSLAREVGGARAELSLRVMNATGVRYATSGWMDYDAAGNLVPVLIPAATRGWLAGLRVDW